MRFCRLVPFVALVLAACSQKQSVTRKPVNLTRQEAMDLAFVLAFWTDNTSLASWPDGPVDMTVMPLAGDWKLNCFAGGTMLLEWRHWVKLDERKILLGDTLHGAMRQTDCTYVLENVKITAANDSVIEYTKTAAYTRGTPTEPFELEINGAFRWITDDGRSGVCAIRYRHVFSRTSQTFHQSGNMCGYVFETTVPASRMRLHNMPWEVRRSQ